MSGEQEGRRAAEKFRADHGLGVQPLPDIVATIELFQGLDVAILDAEHDQHGMVMRDTDRDLIIIAAARTPHPMRQRSTLAHELGHVLFEDFSPEVMNGRTPEEVRADSFARHLLVPIAGLEHMLPERGALTIADLSAVVQRYLVSPSIAALQLSTAGLINSNTCNTWRAETTTPRLATRFGWSDQYEALSANSNHRRAPQRLLARATAGYRDGVLSAHAIARLRRLPVSQVETELSEAGITPKQIEIAWSKPEVVGVVDLSDLDDL